MMNKKTYSCGVLNCGNGKCIHKLIDRLCPHCGKRLVKVTTSGYTFCSNDFLACDYEITSQFDK